MTYESWKHINSIAGFYRKWETPNLGFNIECRYRYDIATNKNNLEIGEEFGWNGFFGNRIAYVLVGYHNVFDGSGYITPGFVLKNVFPNAQLDTGLTINYTREKIDFTLGTKLTLSIGY